MSRRVAFVLVVAAGIASIAIALAQPPAPAVKHRLTSSAAAPAAVVAAKPAGASYVGSARCQSCHQADYAGWSKTRMANVVRDPKQHPEAVLGDFSHPDPLVNFSLDSVAFVYGSRYKQRYFTKIGNNYYVQPAQWDVAKKKWLPYHVGDGTDWWTTHYGKDNKERPTGPLCDGCHSVNYNIQTKTVTEWNVGCEKCHGPGSEHVANPVKDDIVNPDRLDAKLSNDTCTQCHSQGRPKAHFAGEAIGGKWYDWPVGYEAGQKLSAVWSFEPRTEGKTDFYQWPDGTSHKNRMQGNDYGQSVMVHADVRCSSCHQVHSDEHVSLLRQEGNALCMNCHKDENVQGPGVTQTLEEHTHHAGSSAGSQCVGCHMPAIEQTLPGTYVAAHTFKFIAPEETVKSGMPNGCNTCHADKTTAWSIEALKSWAKPTVASLY